MNATVCAEQQNRINHTLCISVKYLGTSEQICKVLWERKQASCLLMQQRCLLSLHFQCADRKLFLLRFTFFQVNVKNTEQMSLRISGVNWSRLSLPCSFVSFALQQITIPLQQHTQIRSPYRKRGTKEKKNNNTFSL